MLCPTILAAAVVSASMPDRLPLDAHRPLATEGVADSALAAGIDAEAGVVLAGAKEMESDRTAATPAITPLIRVMSFNIRTSAALDPFNRWSSRRPGVATILEGAPREGEAVGWDIVGLQEARRHQLDELHRLVPGYGEVAFGRDDGRAGGEHAAILYNSARFSLAASGVFWFSDRPEVPGSKAWGASYTRQCCWARLIDRDSGQGLYVYNVHLDHKSAPSRRHSVRLLAERMAEREHDDPVLVLGDFNAGESSEPLRYLMEDAAVDAGVPLVDTYRLVDPRGPAGTFNRFGRLSGGDKIDYVLAPAGARVVEAGIDRRRFQGRLPSDHYPITATVQLPMRAELARAAASE